MYIIDKPAEFGVNGMPARGQCQPHVKGWRLCWFSRGETALLHVDNYYACRELQRACAGLSLEQARKKVAELASAFANDMQETQKIRAGGDDDASFGPAPVSDETPVDLPALSDDEETRVGDGTEIIPAEEMLQHAQKRRKRFDGG